MISRGAIRRAGLVEATAPLRLRVVPSPAARRLPLLVAGAMSAIHLVVAAVNLSPLMDSYTVATLLDVNHENTLVVWLSSASLLAIAAVATACGFGAAAQSATRRGWWIIAAGFVVLSADETASLHERAGEIASRLLEVDWLPSLYMWVIVVAPIGLAFAVWMLRWFGRTLGWRSLSGRLATLAIGLWLMVPIFEALDPTLGGPRLLVVVEETCEGLGMAAMLAAMLLAFAAARPQHPTE